MSANHLSTPDGRGIALVQNVRVTGAPAAGRYRLIVTIALTPQPSETAPYPWVRSIGGEVRIGETVVGYFEPADEGWRSFAKLAQANDVVLSTLLDASAVLAMDRRRTADQALALTMVLRGVVDEADQHSLETRFVVRHARADPDTRAQIDQFERRSSLASPWPGAMTTRSAATARLDHRMTTSEWTDALRSMRWEDRFLLELPLDGERVAALAPDAAKHMRDALRQLHAREWANAVVACRKTLEALPSTITAPPRAEWKDAPQREAWDAGTRLALVRQAVHHATHLGAHASSLPSVTEAQARLMAHLTASVFASIVGQPT